VSTLPGVTDGGPAAPATTTHRARPPVPAGVRDGRVIAIGRGLDPATVPAIGEALAAGGVRAFEVTLNSPAALEAIAALAERFEPDRLLVGAGTVLDLDAAAAAVVAGARFLVMPHTDPDLVAWATDRGIPAFPGALTPTEVLAAWRAGATAVKVFPASTVGPSFVRELRGPLPQVPLVPTGGITLDSAPDFIAAGALAVGLGSWLTGSGDPVVVEERARAIVAALAVAGSR
jgi:2-dehydro-3-deoxyphosphogluconate aldolase/(4S)-4-hydroxy-2-oxoglutarate aldolase